VSASLGIFSKNLETMGNAADNAADKQAQGVQRTGQAVADAQANLAQAYADTQERIQEATDNEKQNLDDLAAKHAQTIAQIKEQIATLTSDFEEADAERRDNFVQTEQDRRQSFADSQASLEESHSLSVASIQQRERTATTAAARQSAAFAMAQENERYRFAVEMAKKRESEQEAADKRRFDQQEKKAQESYARQKAALEKKLKDEDAQYDAQVQREEKRYDDQLKRLNEAYAKQERATAQHIARTEAAGSGSGPTASAFEEELHKILAAGGETEDQIKAQFAAIAAGTPDVEGLLRGVANGFEAQAEAAKNGGAQFNMAGEAAKLFGRSGAQLLPFLTKGAAGWDAANAQAKKFGLTIGVDGVEHSLEFTKAQADMGFAIEGVKEQIGLELLPVATEFFTFLANWVAGHREEIQTFFEKIGNKLMDFGQYLLAHKEEILGFFKSIAEGIAHVSEVLTGKDGFIDSIERWGEAFKNVGQAFWNIYTVFVLPVIDALGGFVALLKGDWHKALSDWHDALSNFLGFDVAEVGKPFAAFGKMVGNFITSVMNAPWSSMWDGLKNSAKAVVNEVIDALNWMIKGLDKISIKAPSWVPGVGGKGWSVDIPTIPKLAEGGIVTKATLALVGEGGPEAIIPLGRGGGRGGGFAGGGMTINFNAPVTLAPPGSGTDQLRSVGYAVAQQMRSRGLRMIA
jgi:hypothetical protein